MVVDNFELFRKHLLFNSNADRYAVFVLRRTKDCNAMKNELGSNELQRLLKTYYIDSLDYFDKKAPAIRELCRSTKARAYIQPQVRNAQHVLLNVAKIALDALSNGSLQMKPDTIFKAAFCKEKRSARKRWVLDLDNDNLHGWTAEKVIDIVKSCHMKEDDDADLPYVVPTKSGVHVVSAPFDAYEANKKCPLISTFGKKTSLAGGEEIYGWLHRDGLSLLYLDIDGIEKAIA